VDGGARRVDCHYVGRIDVIGGDTGGNNLYFPSKGLVEEGSHRPVDDPRHEDFLVLGTGFPFDEAAWYLARGIVFFVVLDGEGHEIEALGDFLGAAGCGDDSRSAIGGKDRSAGLLRHAASFHDQSLIAYLATYCMYHHTSFLRPKPYIPGKPGDKQEKARAHASAAGPDFLDCIRIHFLIWSFSTRALYPSRFVL